MPWKSTRISSPLPEHSIAWIWSVKRANPMNPITGVDLLVDGGGALDIGH